MELGEFENFIIIRATPLALRSDRLDHIEHHINSICAADIREEHDQRLQMEKICGFCNKNS